MRFGDVFEAIAHKRLAAVDLVGQGSNQHEINGSAALQLFFGADGISQGEILWTRFAEDCEPASSSHPFTFYDARARSAARTQRTEWRLYYAGDPLAESNPGDLLVLARSPHRQVFAMVFAHGSGWERAALTLFPIEADSSQLAAVPTSTLRDADVDALSRAIMERLGIEFSMVESQTITDIVASEFGDSFPSTAEMGSRARELVGIAAAGPDDQLLEWIDMEERLFRALERRIVAVRLKDGFDDVDDFLSYSLSVQNRRKSRMGHALENHFAALFDIAGVDYSRQVRTEGNRTADFVFPGSTEYHESSFPTSRLTVLAAKSTCKDRWPQVLADADRVPTKHLGTLDPALSDSQLTDMLAKDIVPVMPNRLRAGYMGLPNGGRILRVVDFIDLVASREQC